MRPETGLDRAAGVRIGSQHHTSVRFPPEGGDNDFAGTPVEQGKGAGERRRRETILGNSRDGLLHQLPHQTFGTRAGGVLRRDLEAATHGDMLHGHVAQDSGSGREHKGNGGGVKVRAACFGGHGDAAGGRVPTKPAIELL